MPEKKNQSENTTHLFSSDTRIQGS